MLMRYEVRYQGRRAPSWRITRDWDQDDEVGFVSEPQDAKALIAEDVRKLAAAEGNTIVVTVDYRVGVPELVFGMTADGEYYED